VALITGAGSGIGQSTATLFAGEGASICVVDLSEDGARTTVTSIEAAGGESIAATADVSVTDEVRGAVEACQERFGRIDVLVNCAGIGSTQSAVETPEEVWDRVFEVNVRGTFLLCKYVLPHMLHAGTGCIVNIASVAGMVGIRNRAAYCASKGAVISLTQSIAVDHVTQGIRCNCICPGTVDSPWVARLLAGADDPERERAALVARQPMGRLGRPEEVAAAALYLASDDTAFMTGSQLVLDGGWTAQ
jgi:NAD(P)-dependent dehydrogenase (short-subunit alcohol dehydrogenase family)